MNLKLNNNLKIAILLALVLNSALAFSGFYQRNYDSYGHMFFADHYQKSWFDSAEPRWYMGFNVASYPPLAHQILALLGFVTGLEFAYVIITFVLMVLLPIAVYMFSKVFISEEAAGYAAIISVFLPGILMSVYGWGQYTTIFSLVITLFAVPSFHKFVTKGGLFYFAELIFLFEVAIASHHFTGLVFTPASPACNAFNRPCQERNKRQDRSQAVSLVHSHWIDTVLIHCIPGSFQCRWPRCKHTSSNYREFVPKLWIISIVFLRYVWILLASNSPDSDDNSVSQGFASTYFSRSFSSVSWVGRSYSSSSGYFWTELVRINL